DAGGNTLSLDSTGAFSELDNDGTIENATLVLNGGTLSLSSGSVFQNDTIQGSLAIGDGATMVVQSGFALEALGGGAGGTLSITGDDATLEVADSETIAHATVTMGNAQDVTTLMVDSGLTLTSDTTLQTTSSFVTAAITGAGTVINDGTVSAEASSGSLVIGTTDFTNAGLLVVGGGASLAIQTFDAFDNTGTLRVTSGSTATVNSTDTFANTGTIALDGGSLTVNAVLQGAAGVTEISNGGTLELGAAATADQTVSFLNGSGSLVLDDAADFAASVSGFQAGDSIVLAGFAGASESYADGVLTFTETSTALGQAIVTTATIKVEGSYTAGDFSTTTDANGDIILSTDVLPCFVAGTRILTLRGEVAVEDLQIGDAVVTVTDGERRTSPIRWIGRRAVDISRHPAPEKVRPVRVRRGAFGARMPARDLLLSPDHAIFAESVLVPVKYLVDGVAIRVEDAAKTVEYFHVELAQHEVLLSEGLPTESYLDSGGRAMFENGGLPVVLHADFSHVAWDVLGCAPLKVTGPEVQRIRERLAAQVAGIAGKKTRAV
ncbi:Hint domain-containing protein, partial [Acidisoma sp. 7E03]